MEHTSGGKPAGRLAHVDFLKTVGLAGIIIAHVGSPDWLMMLRSFDVPLMVILSALLANRSYAKHERAGTPVFRYYLSRIRRLVLPVWLFLLLYFLIVFAFTGKHESLRYYADSFCLTRYGVGYVWVFLIYLYSAALVPLFARLKLSAKGAVLVCAAYILYETAWHFRIGLAGGALRNVLDTTFYYIIPYGAVTYLGYNYPSMGKRTKYIILLASALVFAGLAVYHGVSAGSFQLVKIAKYPPTLYYLSYGIACSFALLLLCENRSPGLFRSRPVRFVSSHSMWIYLWHILALFLYGRLKLPAVWPVRLLAVGGFAVLMTAGVNRAADALEKRRRLPFLRYFRG